MCNVGACRNSRETQAKGMKQAPLKIGNLTIPGRVFLAPLAGYTSWPFRQLCRRMGAAMVYSEVFKARELVRHIEATFHILKYQPDEHPIGAQVLTGEPEVAGETAAMLCEMGFDLIDINCGCPKRRIITDGLGGGMMESPERIERVVAAMVAQSSVPVTVKLRSGPRRGEVTALEAAQRAVDAGAAAVCLHPRFSEGAATLPPDWTLIKAVKDAVSVPVIGNGGIRAPGDALRMFEETGCDAVMIAQAAFGNPWIFRQIETLLATGEAPPKPGHDEILALLLEHYNGLIEHHGEKRGAMMMRKQSCHYAKSLINGRKFNEAVIHASTRAEFMAAVDQWLRPARTRNTTAV